MENIEKKLDKILFFLHILARDQITNYLLDNLKDNQELLLYKESNGENTVKDLNKITGISTGKISLCWNKWEKMGLIEKLPNRRGKRIFNPENYGIKEIRSD